MAHSQILTDSSELDRRPIPPRIRRNTSIICDSEEVRSIDKSSTVILIDASGSTYESIFSKNIEKKINRIIIDQSSSESIEKKIDGILKAVRSYIVNVSSSSHLSLIVFAGTAHVLRSLSVVGNTKQETINLVAGIRPNGGTPMKEACVEARKQLEHSPDKYFKRILLLSDGKPDRHFTKEITDLKNDSVEINTIGFGQGNQIDEEFLKKIASTSSTGKKLYYYCKDAESLEGLFKRKSRFAG